MGYSGAEGARAWMVRRTPLPCPRTHGWITRAVMTLSGVQPSPHANEERSLVDAQLTSFPPMLQKTVSAQRFLLLSTKQPTSSDGNFDGNLEFTKVETRPGSGFQAIVL